MTTSSATGLFPSFEAFSSVTTTSTSDLYPLGDRTLSSTLEPMEVNAANHELQDLDAGTLDSAYHKMPGTDGHSLFIDLPIDIMGNEGDEIFQHLEALDKTDDDGGASTSVQSFA